MPLSEPSQNPAAAPTRSPLKFWLLIATLLLALIGGSYFLKTSLNQFELNRKSALPILRQLRDPFVALDRSGTEKNLADLEGKAVILAYTYTRCPHGCAGVAAQMLKIRDAFASQSNVHLVSIAVWPEIDTAPILKAFSESIGVRPEDRNDATIDEADPDYGFFSPHSWWPIAVAIATGITVMGLVFAVWLGWFPTKYDTNLTVTDWNSFVLQVRQMALPVLTLARAWVATEMSAR